MERAKRSGRMREAASAGGCPSHGGVAGERASACEPAPDRLIGSLRARTGMLHAPQDDRALLRPRPRGGQTRGGRPVHSVLLLLSPAPAPASWRASSTVVE